MSGPRIRHAVWHNWLHVGECYRVRNRGAPSAFSREGFVWTDSYGTAVSRPAPEITFWGGALNGQTIVRERKE